MVAAADLLGLVGGVLLLFANGFFVTTEFALTRVRQFSRDQFAGKGLDRAWEMTEKLELYLSGCQLGITISSVGLGIVAEPAVSRLLDGLLASLGVIGGAGATHAAVSVTAAVVLINLLHVIVAEQAPTYLGVERTRFVCRYGALPLYWWTKLTWPVIRFADRIAKGLLGVFGVEMTRSWTEEDEEVSTRGDLRRQMGQALSGAGVSGERQREVLRALEIGDLPVREIMIDRGDIVALSTEEELETNLERMRTNPYVRFPLVGDGLGNPRGTVYVPVVLRHLSQLHGGSRTLEEVAAPPMTVPADAAVSEAIDAFQEENQEMALVRDNERVVGLITATDAFEAIIGEIEDPVDLEMDR